MQIVDFDAQFSHYMTEWTSLNAKAFHNVDEMEVAMPDVYMRWLNTPADWLGGVAPGLFFAPYDDAGVLVAWMREYLDSGVSVPDPLLERIVELGEGACLPLTGVLMGQERAELQMMAMSLLTEIDINPPLEAYLRLIHIHDGEGELAVRASEALRSVGAGALPACLDEMEGASAAVRLCLMDMLADFPGEDAVRAHARALLREGCAPAVMAAYIARMDDTEALDDLYAAAKDPSLDYLAYVEITGAIEALGGEPPETREFAGDPAYESLRGMTLE